MTGRLLRSPAPSRALGVVRRPRPRLIPLALACVVSLAGCGVLSDGGDDTDGVGTDSSTSAVDTGLTTVSWGVFDGMASVLVRNDTDQLLRRADAVARVVDRSGTALASSVAMDQQGQCCSAANVPPGGVYGFYFAVGDRGDQVDHVLVDYTDVAFAPADDGPSISGEPVDLYANDEGEVAVVDLVTTGGPVGKAVVQARLDDADGNFLGVVSGRFTCLSPDSPTRAELQLFHEVPDGTTLASVAAYPLTDGAGDDPSEPVKACSD